MNQNFINELAKRVQRTAVLKPVGELWFSIDGSIPYGGIPFLGGAYSKTMYKSLYEYAKSKDRIISEARWQEMYKDQNGNVPYYSDVSDAEFRVPCINGYLKGAESIGESGKYVPEGLPNITGKVVITKLGDGFASESGALYNSGGSTNVVSGGSWGKDLGIGLDASRSSPVYGASDHVTPETITLLMGVYAFSVVQDVGTLDGSQVHQQLTEMSSRILDKSVVARYPIETWTSADKKSWYCKYSDGWCEQGGRVKHLYKGSVTFSIPFNGDESVFYAGLGPVTKREGASYDQELFPNSVSATGFSVINFTPNSGSDFGFWYACGYYK